MSYTPKRMKGEDPYQRMRREYEESGNRIHKTSNKKKSTKKRKNNEIDIIFKILAVIYILVTIIFYRSVTRLNMLPTSYVVIFTIAEIIFTVLIVLGLGKRHKTYKLNIVCLVIALLISGVYLYVSNYANATKDFLGSMFQEVQETEEYYVVVRSESEYDELNDLDGESIYTFQLEDDVKTDVENQIEVTFESGSNLTDLGNDLLDESIDAILISSSQYSIIDEEIENFIDNTKIIYTAHHAIKKVENVSSEGSKYTINNGTFNVYISGIDTSGSISNVSRSDANILVTVNTNTHEILLTSIPRDYYVTLHSKGAKDKLTHSGLYGVNETVTTVEDLLDTEINYYIRVNFTTVIRLVDVLGGIQVYSDYDFTAQGYHFNQGYNYLNGEQALAFSRERHSFASGDNQRVKNQQAVIEAIINKVLSAQLFTNYTNILDSLEGSFQTNITESEINKIVQDQLSNMSSWNIDNNALVGSGSSGPTYSLGNVNSYIMLPDSSSVAEAKEKINEVLGE